jgi:hypothetical protein
VLPIPGADLPIGLCASYANLIDSDKVSQSSQNGHWQLPRPPFSPHEDPEQRISMPENNLEEEMVIQDRLIHLRTWPRKKMYLYGAQSLTKNQFILLGNPTCRGDTISVPRR